jgi:hypothetical protein
MIFDGIANGSAGETQVEVDAESLDGRLTPEKAGVGDMDLRSWWPWRRDGLLAISLDL